MVVFVDTSAIYALANESDSNHDLAESRFRAALEAGEELLLHNYILLEAIALLGRRGGRIPVTAFLTRAYPFRTRWVDAALHQAAAGRYVDRSGRYSFVDEVSFLVMEEAGSSRAFAFDRDFKRVGFRLYRPS